MSAARAARIYRDLGLSPLPSRGDRKMPALPEYRQHRSEPLPDCWFRDWKAPNIQLMCGCEAYGPTKILVVDCDGEEAKRAWGKIASAHGPLDYGWLVKTGSGGSHWYFRVPDDVTSVPTGMIWGVWDTYGDDGRGKWCKHKEIKILGEGALAVAPPSRHVETGAKYEFCGFNPVTKSELPEAPRWLLDMPRLSAPRFGEKESRGRSSPSPNRQQLLDSIPDKAALAASWGLRLTSVGPNQSGWMTCRAVGRDDSTPSAAFHAQTGIYKDFSDGSTLGLFDLAAALGAFGDWKEAIRWCESTFLPSPYLQAHSLRRDP